MPEFTDKHFARDLLTATSAGTGPKYARCTRSLRTFITENRIQPGTFLPSERELAKELGVSSITIKRALRDLAAEGVIERQQGVGTIVKDPSTRPGSAGLFLACGQSSRNYLELLAGVERTLSDLDHPLLYSNVAHGDERESERLQRLIQRNAVRLILLSGWVDDRYVRFAKSLGPPVVVIGNYPLTETVSQICADTHGAVVQAVELFLAAGVKRIGLLNGAHRYGMALVLAQSFEEIVDNYRDRLERSAIVWCETPGQDEPPAKLLEQLGSPAGVIAEGAHSYELALLAARSGRSIPEDLKIIGFGTPAKPDTGPVPLAQMNTAWETELPTAINNTWELLSARPKVAVKFFLPMLYVPAEAGGAGDQDADGANGSDDGETTG